MSEACFDAAGVKVHPAAELFPMMDAEDYGRLKESISESGQSQPIIFWEEQLLDGRNRLKACWELDVEPEVVHKTKSEIPNPAEYVWTLNGPRRMLSKSQLAMVGAKLKKMIALEARENQSLVGGDKKTALGTFTQSDPGAENAGKNSREPKGFAVKRINSREVAGQLVGVSGRLINHGEKVQDYGSPELNSAVASGAIAVGTAARLVEAVPDTGKQSEILAEGSKAIAEVIRKSKQKWKKEPAKKDRWQLARENKKLLENHLYAAQRAADDYHRVNRNPEQRGKVIEAIQLALGEVWGHKG